MNLPTPNFSVDEDVLIYSTTQSDIQGVEAVVVERTHLYGAIVTGDQLASGWFYKLDPIVGVGGTGVWHESSLRRKPSDPAFKKLMESLSKPLKKKEKELI